MLSSVKHYSFRLGDLECVSLYDNSSTSSIKEAFPNAQISSPDEIFNVGFNCLYIKQNQKNILIDTGTGQGELLNSLAGIGVSPSDIDTVILTHGDRDHIGGVLIFPNANFIVSKKLFTLWDTQYESMIEEFIKLFRQTLDTETLKAREQPRRIFATNVFPKLKPRLLSSDFEDECLPGIKLIDATGHRNDHTALEINSRGETLIHIVDSFRHPLQIKHNWTSFIDSYPEQVKETNQRLVDRIVKTNALIFGAHLAFPGLARINKDLEWQWVTM